MKNTNKYVKQICLTIRDPEKTYLEPEELKGINYKAYMEVGHDLCSLTGMQIFREKTRPVLSLNRATREGLKLKVSLLFADVHEILTGEKIDKFGLIISSALQGVIKSYTWDRSPENKEKLLNSFEEYPESLTKAMRQEITEKTSGLFMSLLEKYSAKDEKTLKIAEAAKIYVNIIQLQDIDEHRDWKHEYMNEGPRLIGAEKETLKKFYAEFPFIEEIINRTGEYKNLEDVIWKMEGNQYIYRWQNKYGMLNFNLMEHMYVGTPLCLFLGLEAGLSIEDATEAAIRYSIHDDPEQITGDIPGPLKNKVKGNEKNLRQASEQMEKEAIENSILPLFPSFIRPRMKQLFLGNDIGNYEEIMNSKQKKRLEGSLLQKTITISEVINLLSDKKQSEAKKILLECIIRIFVKFSDYFTAVFEAFWGIKKGSNSKKYFTDVLNDRIFRTPEADKTVVRLRKEASRMRLL